MRKHGYLAKTKDVLQIIRRMDLDGDARLSKDEFIRALMPEDPYSKLVKRQKDKERSRSKFNEKINLQGVNSLHHQDPVLNVRHGGRDNLRVQAQERELSAGHQRRRSYQTYGDVGSSALKIRPDLNRMDSNLFAKSPVGVLYTRPKQNIRSDKALILPKKYQEHIKENFYKKLRKGRVDEDFVQKREWKPGGNAVKTKSQKDADKALVKMSQTMKRSVSRGKTKKVKKIKRVKSSNIYKTAGVRN